VHFLCGIDGADKYGKRVRLRCRYIVSGKEVNGVIEKARAIMSGHKLKSSQSLPEYFNPADIGSWRLAGHIGYES